MTVEKAKQDFHELDIEIGSPVSLSSISLDGRELKGVTKIKFDWSPENLVRVEIEMIVQKGKISLEQLRLQSAVTPLDVREQPEKKVKKFTWVAIIDDQTCAHCSYMDGKTVREDSGIKPPLPQCVNEKGEGKCRCVLKEKK